MKFADKLVGKGIETWIIVQLIVYNLSWMVVLVVPMAVLVATLMAYGNLSQNNEVTIMKSSGISLYKMMLAPFLASIVVAYLLLLFNNDVLPDANHMAKILMTDISRKKPTLSLEPGFFSQEVPNYAILVRKIDENNNDLFDLTIYDYSQPGKINVVTAKQGKIFFSKDQTKLLMDLKVGEIHESEASRTNLYRKLVFNRHIITMDAEQFSFQQSGPGVPRGERELSTQDMLVILDSLYEMRDETRKNLAKDSYKYFFADSNLAPPVSPKVNIYQNKVLYARVVDKIKTTKNVVLSNLQRVEWTLREIEKYEVEVYKKFAIPAACMVFILIGAPLGVMVRKGGFGVAASISLLFFLIYWAFLIGGEKLSERGFFSPFIGMWAANIILGISGILLTLKTNRETITIQFTMLKKLIPKQWRSEEPPENAN
jgi:lipopolysaccharide export system permease protein